MASQISPGVVIKERDLTNAVVVGAQQITAAFASTFQKGPINEIVNISSQRQLVEVFGKPSSANAEDWYVASEFMGYGGRLSVVRAKTTDVKNATASGSAILIRNDLDWEAGTGSAEVFAARTAGTWGNSVKVVVVDRGADQYVTFASAPASIAAGSNITFTGGATAEVLAWNANTLTASIILDDPTVLVSTTDTLDIPDTGIVSTFTSNVATDSARTPGSYSVSASGGSGSGATFTVTVLDAGVEGGGAATGVGGTTTITLTAGGTGYVPTDTLLIEDSFLNGGGGADIIVTVSTVVDSAIGIVDVKDWYTTTQIEGTSLLYSAIGPRPGTSDYAASRGIKYDEIHVAVIDTTGNISGAQDTIVERFAFLSKLIDASNDEGSKTFYKEVLNEQSAYLYAGATVSAGVNPSTAGGGEAWAQLSTDMSSGDMFALVANTYAQSLSGGADDYDYNVAEISEAYELFSDTEETNVDFILMGGSMNTQIDTKAKAAKVMAIADLRKDCIAFVSPHKENQVGTGGALTTLQQKINTINFFNSLSSSSYAVFDSGYKYYYDRFNDKYIYIPCNGDVAGLCVSTSAILDDWYSPAGVNRGALRNAVKLAYNPNKADRDELYQNRINPIVSFPGAGVTLFGDKTALAATSAFDRINVRRLFLNIRKRADVLARGVLFEQNDATTRALFAGALNSYMSEIQSRRGVTDFLVVCDESNNTPDVIDRNEFVAEIFIKPTRSINFITITLTATKTGVSFAEVVGR